MDKAQEIVRLSKEDNSKVEIVTVIDKEERIAELEMLIADDEREIARRIESKARREEELALYSNR